MPVRPEKVSNLFTASITANAVNPIVGRAAPSLISSTNGGVTGVIIGFFAARVANLVVSIFNIGAGVTLDFKFIESDNGGGGTYTDIPKAPSTGLLTAPVDILVARLDTQFVTKKFIGADFDFAGVGTFDLNAVWLLQDFQNYPHAVGFLPQRLLDVNQVDMF